MKMGSSGWWILGILTVAALVSAVLLTRESDSQMDYSAIDTVQDEVAAISPDRMIGVDLAGQSNDKGSVAPHKWTDVQLSPGLKRVVRFPDGDEIGVTFQSAESLKQKELSGAGNGDFESLRRLALDGNGAAAYEVYKLQLQCANVPATTDALGRDVARMYETYSVPDTSNGSGTRQLGSETDLGLMEQRMRTQYGKCQEVSASDDTEPLDFLRIAADAGTYPATLEFARKLEKEDIQSAVKYFEIAWDHGDVNAVIALGQIYLQGYENVPPDRQKAFAYTYVGSQLSTAFYDGQSGEAVELVRTIVEERSEKRLADFYPSEVEAATPLAKAILRKNQRCCVY